MSRHPALTAALVQSAARVAARAGSVACPIGAWANQLREFLLRGVWHGPVCPKIFRAEGLISSADSIRSGG
jgi:hypothetical protein